MLTIRRRRFSVLAICLATLFATPAAFAQTLYDFNLPSQALADSLRAIGHQTSVNILFDPRSVEKLTAPAVHGQFSASQAVARILAGTNLVAEQTEANTLLVEPKDKAGKAQAAATLNDPPDSARVDSQTQAGKKSSQDFRLAQVDRGISSSDSSIGSVSDRNPQKDSGGENLSEIVVTAEKREEKLQDVPVPVTVINGQALVDRNQLRLQDYYTAVPGLSVTAGNSSSDPGSISIRGITTGPNTNPSVGIEVDDVPFGSSGQYGGGNLSPDIDPSDLSRVEVLRGPQGTLYGASSLGGLIKFVTIDPSVDRVSGRVEAGTSGVYNGTEPGYNFRAAVNVPLSDTFAIRASAFTRDDPGYIDNPVTHADSVNESHVSGGRLAAIWLPTADFTLKLSALYQKFTSDGVSEVDAGLRDLQQDYLPGCCKGNGTIQAYSATMTGKVGDINVTALSGYNVRQGHYTFDTSSQFNGLTLPLYGVAGSVYASDFDTSKFSQEIRLSAPIGKSVDWLLGGFYTHEDSSQFQSITANDVASGAAVATSYYGLIPSVYSESAAFANITVHFTDQLDVQLGGRESNIRQTFAAGYTFDPLFTGGDTATQAGTITRATATPVTYLLTSSFKVNADLMVYARFASGYRPGGPNAALCTVEHFACEFSPDKTQNYEIGAKGDFLDHMISFDASAYYIDWKNIQLTATAGDFGYEANAAAAKSEGVELSVEIRPLAGMVVSAWVAYDDAVLTQSFPADVSAYGAVRDRLPYTSRVSGNVSLNQEFRISDRVTGFLGGAVSYVGDRLGVFAGAAGAPAPRQDLPGYARTDLRTGVRYDNWTCNVFANNVFDKRGLIDGGQDLNPPSAYIIIQPRTVGVSVAKSF